MKMVNTDTLEKIQAMTDERKLYALAWYCHGCMKSGQITSKYYSECMIALTEKLGFPPLEENLKTVEDFEDKCWQKT